MSLKAKIEAVIYASEEPVTLAQLVGLLGEEGQAELNAARSRQSSLALEDDSAAEPEAGDHDALNSEVLETEAGTSESSAVALDPAPETVAAELPTAEDPGPGGEKQAAREAAAEARARERALRDYFRALIEQLMSDYADSGRGLEVREVAGGYRLATKPEYHDAVRGFVKSLKPPLKLSLQALETLAVVAYKQPVTAPEISEIRGVDSGGVLGGLLARKLITTAGRKPVIGRPILYKTTKDFLVRFGLKDVNELPSIEEFEKMAGELADADPVQEEIPMDHPQRLADEVTAGEEAEGTFQALDEMNTAPEPADPHDVEPMAGVHEPQGDGDSSPTDEEEEEAAQPRQPIRDALD
jgi:segregation and condensation protein B